MATVKKSKKAKKPVLKDGIKFLRGFFLKADLCDAMKLWYILSALRGPDDSNAHADLKPATTEVIRHALFGQQAGERVFDCGADVSKDSSNKKAFRTNFEDFTSRRLTGGSHFEYHARFAFNALELEWDKENSVSD